MRDTLPSLRRPINRPLLPNFINPLRPDTGPGRFARLKAAVVLPALGLLFALVGGHAGYAQTVDQYTLTASTGTYTALTGANAMTLVADGANTNTDEGKSGNLPIGFTFSYENTPYTTFSASTNGFIRLGNNLAGDALATAGATNNLATGTARPIIAPLWDDIDVVLTTNLTYLTTGAAGSRILTVEWKGVKWDYNSAVNVISYQAKLYEGSTKIDFVYSQGAGTINNLSGGASIGLGGATSGKFLSLQNVSTAPTVSRTTETTNIATKPANNQVYSFQLVAQTYTSSTVTQAGGILTRGGANQQVATLQVLIPGVFPTLPITQVVANTTGTTSPMTDLTSAQLYYGGANSTFSTATLFGSAIVSPSGTLTFNGSVIPSDGAVYFFLAFNVAPGATLGNSVDAQITSVTVGGTPRTPTVTNPSPQKYTIFGPGPLDGIYTIDGGQSTDVFSGGTNFKTFGEAVSALNNLGISTAPLATGVEFRAADGQTFTESNLVLNQVAGANASRPIVFTRDGNGASGPTISAAQGAFDNTSTGPRDFILALNGADFVTISGISFIDPLTNTTTATRMEYGIVMLRTGTGSTLNGCNKNTVQNCTITLQKGNTTTTSNTAIGIASLNSSASDFVTALSVGGAGTSGQSSNNTFYGNTIQNVNTGIYLVGAADTAPFANYDQGNDVGGTAALTGNRVRNFGGSVAATAYGIRVLFQNGVNLTYNTVDNVNAGGVAPQIGTASLSTLFGIQYDAGASNVSVTANFNNITLGQAANAAVVTALGFTPGGTTVLNVGNNLFAYAATSGATGNMFAISTTGNIVGTGSVNISNNIFANSTNIGTAGSLVFIYDLSNASLSTTIASNQFKSITKTSAGANVFGVFMTNLIVAGAAGGTLVVNNNLMQAIRVTGATGFTGISLVSGTVAQVVSVMNNTVDDVANSGAVAGGTFTGYSLQFGGPNSVVTGNVCTNLTNAGQLIGMRNFGGFQTGLNWADNKIGNLTVNTVGNGLLAGMYLDAGVANATITYQRNRVYNVSNNFVGTATAYGFFVAGAPTNLNIYNNLIGGVNAPATTSLTTPAVAGLRLSAGTNINVYHNTIRLSGANSTAAVTATIAAGISAVTTVALDLRNNLVVNTIAPAGANTSFLTVAFYRVGLNTAANYLASSNGNLFYAGAVGSAQRLLFFDGTNSIQTLTGGPNAAPFTGYKRLLASQGLADRDFTTVTEVPTFVTTTAATPATGTAAVTDDFLRLSPSVPTQAAKGGVASPATTDYVRTARNATTPHIGAYEGTLTVSDLIGPNIVYTPMGNGLTGATSRTFTATITDATGVATGSLAPRLYYKVSTSPNAVASANNNTVSDGYKYVPAGTPSGDTYTFTLNYNLLSVGSLAPGDKIEYFVVAQDIVATPNVSLYAGPAALPALSANAPTSVNLATNNLPLISTLAPVSVVNFFTLTGGFTGTFTVGTTGAQYASLTAAAVTMPAPIAGGIFEAINNGVVTGNVIINIIDNTTESGEVSLKALNTEPANSSFTITIQSANTSQYLLGGGGIAGGMIRLDGVKNVTFDGGSAATKRLLFRNSGANGTPSPTFAFINGATNNTLTGLQIEGVDVTATTGTTVLFGTVASGTVGNSNNTISNCDIRESTQALSTAIPTNAIYSAGTGTALNAGNVIKGNLIRNFSNSGVNLATNSDAWVIGSAASVAADGNSFTQDAPRSATQFTVFLSTGFNHKVRYNGFYQSGGAATGTYFGVITNSTAVNGLDVSFNTFGGSQKDGGGSPFLLGGAVTTAAYFGINLNTLGTTQVSNVQGNTVRNVQITNTATTSSSTGIIVVNGWVNMGNLAPNFVGDSTAALGVKSARALFGMRFNPSINGSIFSDNVVRNLGTVSGLTDGADLRGISLEGAAIYTAERNRVKELLNASPVVARNAVAFGMTISNSSPLLVVRRNKISDIRYTLAATSTITNFTEGMVLTATTAAGAQITENTIWNLSTAATGTTAELVRGIENSGSATIANNRISLTGSTGTSIIVQGITDFSTGTPNYLHNSVYMAGTSIRDTYVYQRFGATTTATLRNNIFYNNFTGSGNAYALAIAAGTFSSSSSNNNFLVSATLAGVALNGATPQSLPQFQASTGGDLSSFNDTPTGTPAATLFIDPASNLKINPAYYTTPSLLESRGAVTSITTDFEGDARPGPAGSTNGGGNTPDIGADEFDGTLSPDQSYASSTVVQVTTPTSPAALVQPVVYLSITATNSALPLVVSSVNVNLTGTTNFGTDLATPNSVRLYYSTSTTFNAGTATLFGTALTPAAGPLTFTGSQTLIANTVSSGNYFFLTYDVASGATNNNVIDGQITSFVLTGGGPGGNPGTKTPTVANPAGSRTIKGAFNGDFYVGTTLGTEEYATITDALAGLVSRGIDPGTAQVNMILTNPAATKPYNVTNGETFPLVLPAVPGMSATSRVTMKPNTGTAVLVTASVGTGAVIKLNGTDYFTIDGSNNGSSSRDLTIENTNGSGAGNGVVWLASASASDGATNNTLKNTIVRGSAPGTPNISVFIGGSTTIGNASAPLTNQPNNTISNNLITFGFASVAAIGLSAASPDAGTTISNNQIGTATDGGGFVGLLLTSQTTATIEANTIRNVGNANTTTARRGITMTDVKSSRITRNNIFDVHYTGTGAIASYGILSFSTAYTTSANPSNNQFDNNLISAISSPLNTATGTQAMGLYIQDSYGEKVYFNTIYLSEVLGNGTGIVAAFGNLTTGIDVRNNVFVVNGSTTAAASLYAYYTTSANYTTDGSTSNYNNLFAAASGSATAFVGFLSSNRVDLAAWQLATGQEANSKNADPAFVQVATVPYNLTPTALGLDGTGVTIAGLTTDYANVARTSPPDMGAIEFAAAAIDVLPIAVLNPANNTTICGTTTGVRIRIRNNGTAVLTPTVPNPVTITVNVTGATTQSFTYQATTGSVASGDTISYVVGNLNLAPASGNYTFAVTTTYTGDAVASNNTLTPNPVRTITAPTAFPYFEDFNAFVSGTVPTGYTADPGSTFDFRVQPYGVSASQGVKANLYNANLTSFIITPSVGPAIGSLNQLTFDLRFANFNATTAFALASTDKVDVMVSYDCGANYTTVYTINSTNYNGNGSASAAYYTYTVPLTGMTAGQTVRVQFMATTATTSGVGYDVQLDNIRIAPVPAVDVAPTALATPTATQCYNANEIVRVTVKNTGSAVLDLATNPITASALVTYPNTTSTTLSGTLNTGTVAVGATVDVALTPPLNMSAAGTYVFSLSATAVGDGTASNNNLSGTISRTVLNQNAGTASATATTICQSGPTTLSLAGNSTGAIQWFSSASPMSGFMAIPGANSNPYTTGTLTGTTYFYATVSCGLSATSNTVTVTVNSSPTFAGTMPSVSGTYCNVVISGDVTLTGPLNVISLTIQSGGSLNTNCQTVSGSGAFTMAAGSKLFICSPQGLSTTAGTGAIQMTGTRTISPDASFVYNGTVAQFTGNGLPARVLNLTVDNAAGVKLTNAVSVAEVATITNGTLDTNAKTFTLLARRGIGTALIVEPNATTTAVIGTGTMQRAVDILTSDNIGYHHYSSPVVSTAIEDLQAPGFDFVINDNLPVQNGSPRYNVAALAGLTRPFPTVFGYDDARTTSTTLATDQNAFNKGFVAPNSGDLMAVGRGYTASVPNAVLIDFAGTFNNGAVTIGGLTRASSDPTTGYHLLGNPYPAPIDWSTMGTGQFTGGVQTAIYQYHATSRYTGFYTTHQINGLTVGTNGNASLNSPLINAGAGFFAFMPVGTTSGSIALANANRVTTFGAQPNFGRSASTLPQLLLQVRGAASQDELLVYTDATATAGIDATMDAAKLANPNGMNLAALAAGKPLAIDALPTITATTVVPLTLGVPAAGRYTFDVAQLANLGTTRACLRDAVTGTETPLTAGTQVPVTLTNVATATTRFSLVFRPSGALATTASLTAGQVSLYPNPAHASFTVLLPPVAGAKDVNATLLNALGQVITTRTIALTAAGATAEFNTSALAQGVYMLRLTAGSETLTQRVVIE